MNINKTRSRIIQAMQATAFINITCSVINVALAVTIHPLWLLNGLVCLSGGIFTLRECRKEEIRIREKALRAQ